jgi:hypothetical protein
MASILTLLWRAARRSTLYLAGLSALAALMVACGGGVDSGGTGSGSYATGPITGYGSIIVGGVHYDESSARVEDDSGTERSPDDLKLGMVTEIHASDPVGADGMQSATATAVRFRSELVGPVEAIDETLGTLTVLGQKVQIDATTVFDARLAGGLAALHVDDVVEVFGQLDVSTRQRYTATRIEPVVGAASYKLRGIVTAVYGSGTLKTLVIGGQTIDFSTIVSSVRPSRGQLLRVVLGTSQVAGNWVASAIEIGARQLPDRDSAEVEGRITAFTSIEMFEVDGIPIATDAATLFPDGSAGVVLGARVEVHGRSSGGTLNATRVEIEAANHGGPEPFEFSGIIQSLDTTAQTFVMRGFTVHWSDTTRFETGTNASSLRNFREAEVKGALSADGTRLEATFINVETG